MLERQKRREKQYDLNIPLREESAGWFVLTEVELLVERLRNRLSGLLPGVDNLRTSQVQMKSYTDPQPGWRLRLKAQVSGFSRGKLLIKVHCHQIDSQGKLQKLAMSTYHYRSA